MKLSRLIRLLPAAVILVLASCSGGGSVSERVADAEMAYAAEDVALTRRIVDDIVSDPTAKGSITATELARLSILYMQLNDRTDDHEAVDLAADCYREAYRANPDSAAWFYTHLSSDDQKYVMVLASIVHSMDNPKSLDDITEDHEFADSIDAE